MADKDPISSDSTPYKRRRVDEYGNGVDSQNDSSDYGEDITEEDFQSIATLPQSQGQKRKQLQYSTSQFHKDVGQTRQTSSVTAGRTSSPAFVTQPTQTMREGTVPTQSLAHGTVPTQTVRGTVPTHAMQSKRTTPTPVPSDIQVAASSPAKAPSSSPPRTSQPPSQQPFKRPSIASKGGFLANVMAPRGSSYQAPVNVRKRAATPTINLDDSDEDPPVNHSSDEETQGRSNLKPTNFKKGTQPDSTPNRPVADRPVVKESPASSASNFGEMVGKYGYQQPANDSASAYASYSRAPRPAPKQTASSRAQPINTANMVRYKTIADIQNWRLEQTVKSMLETFPHETVDRCMTALQKNRQNMQDALAWLTEDEEKDAPGDDDDDADDLASMTPAPKRGVAIAKTSSSSQHIPMAKSAAKQQVDAPSKSIAQKYGSTQPARKQSQSQLAVDDEDDVKPRRRLQQGRRPRRSPTPPTSPPVQKAVAPPQRRQAITISDDEDEAEDSDSGIGRSSEAPEEVISSHDEKLLKFFNECSIQDLSDISAQPESIAQMLVDRRPFASLDEVRTISTAAQTTKSGKASRSKPIGEKIVDVCSEMWEGYDAVDELVEQCEKLARPIQDALKTWGVGATEEGELQVMSLDDAHDSGVGTPASSTGSDDAPQPRSNPKGLGKSKSKRFLGQPESMSSDVRLKDYQLVGLNWLNLLYSQRLSCILADDMGLGKTCQVISFLAYLQQTAVDGVHLVIVPGSTLENWLREFSIFAPELKVVPYYGSQKERGELQDRIEEEFGTIDVIVTTYDMAVGEDDNKFLRKHLQPMVCVYDEAHALRNTNSKRYKQLTRIPADFRILLTGTPLQNNLQELVAILAFIMPEMFREKNEQLQYIFQHKATTKSADHGALLSAQRIARARTMMTPFILRRKKQQVLDLPAKHSRVEYCDMTPDQADYYAEVVEEAQAFFADKGAGKNAAGKKASSNVLMSLRKAAIHPLLSRRHFNEHRIDKMVDALLNQSEFQGNRPDQVKGYLEGTWNQKMDGGSSDFSLNKFCMERPYLKKFAIKGKKPWMDSGKVKKFCELIKAFAANADRTLVFSQFTSMMDILESVLETLNIKFMRLDGSTNMQLRQDMIDKFTNDTSISVFMLSTKAGGAGINLAAANKVLIFDAGFNPQDDIQAENRAHRVGQTREVEVVRLVVRGTIEEQIHALGESKLALDERVAGEAGAKGVAGEDGEKKGEEFVKGMFLDGLAVEKDRQEQKEESDVVAKGGDLKDMFKSGMEKQGVKVASKQAQY